MAAAPELLPELGPEEEVTVRAAPRLGLVVIFAVAAGMILCIEAIVRGFFGTISGVVGWIPYLGGVITEPIHKIEQKVTSFLGGLEKDIDQHLAHNLHLMARLLEQMLRALETTAATVVLLGALATAAVFHYAIHPLEKWVRGAIRKVEEEIHRIERGTIRRGAVITHTIIHNIYPRVRAATVAVPRYIHRDLLSLRRDVNKADKAATHALKKAESIPFPKGAKTWAEAVALALPALGLDWLRCKSNPFNKNSNACGLWTILKDLLGLFTALFTFAVFCDFWATVEPFIGDILAPVIALSSTFANGVCSHRPGGWQNLDVPLSLPAASEITQTVMLP